MIVITGTLQVDAARLDEFMAAASEMVAQTRREDGCDLYCVAVEDSAAGQVVLAERWRDLDTLKAHNESAHMARFREVARPLMRGMDARAFHTGDEVSLR